MRGYNKKVIEHFLNPKNSGIIEDAALPLLPLVCKRRLLTILKNM
jgi:NifU-like protein involved in Fe-S cluster formation